MVISQRPSARRRSVPSPLDLLFAMLLLSFIWQQGVSHLKLNNPVRFGSGCTADGRDFFASDFDVVL